MRAKRKGEGRPSDFRRGFVKQAHALTLLGATDEFLAEFFGVSVATLNNWKHRHPQFLESIKRGKAVADAQVAGKLFQRANGFRVKAVKIFQKDGVSFEHEYQEFHPPDVTAQIFWLKNRQPGLWRDKQEQVHSNPDGSALISPEAIAGARMVAELLYEKAKGEHPTSNVQQPTSSAGEDKK